ncbi:Probable F-box protein At3g61730, partial [Linum grandiflorum]
MINGSTTAKRLRGDQSLIRSCKSPRLCYQEASPRSFNFYELDAWTEIAKFLDGKSMMKLALTCRWFHRAMMQDNLWKSVCLSHLQVPAPDRTEFKWFELYASAINGSHSYTFRVEEKHLDCMRLGAFFLESASALLIQRLTLPLKIMKRDPLETMLASNGACLLTDLRRGIWIADLQLVGCPVCKHNTCEGTMQILDARHIELFLSEGFQNGSWVYDQIGSYEVKEHVNAASAAMLDLKHITDPETADVFNSKLWAERPNPCQPKAMISYHHVAISTHLEKNQGLVSKYYVM